MRNILKLTLLLTLAIGITNVAKAQSLMMIGNEVLEYEGIEKRNKGIDKMKLSIPSKGEKSISIPQKNSEKSSDITNKISKNYHPNTSHVVETSHTESDEEAFNFSVKVSWGNTEGIYSILQKVWNLF